MEDKEEKSIYQVMMYTLHDSKSQHVFCEEENAVNMLFGHQRYTQLLLTSNTECFQSPFNIVLSFIVLVTF